MRFLIFSMIAICAAPAFSDESVYTRIDAKAGLIQLVKGNRVIQFSTLDPKNFHFRNEFDLIDVPKSKFSKEDAKTANILNMESQWLSGRRLIIADGKEYPVDVKEVILATRVVVAKYNGQPLKELNREQDQKIDQFVNDLKTSVAQLVDEEVTGIKRNPDMQLSKFKIETSFEGMLKTVGDVAKSGSTLLITLLDGNVYVLGANDGSSPLVYRNVPGAGHTLYLKTAGSNLLCDGMSQEQIPPNSGVVLKIDQNFAPISHFNYNCTGAECIALVNTANGATNCTNTADRIYGSSFERGER